MSGLWSSDRPEFVERVAALAGETAYRVPMGGRGTQPNPLPDAHAVAAALAFARLSRDDIGPDVAYAWATQSDAGRQGVIRRLSIALRQPALRTVVHHRLAAAEAAWDTMIHGRPGARPPAGCPATTWDMMLMAALSVLYDSAWDALRRAERAYLRAG